jgi:Mg-chelatase subunit ChlI
MSENDQISFSASVVLRHNKKFLDCPDMSPNALKQFVEQHAQAIRNRIDELHKARTEQAHRPETKIAPSILIARLALRGSEKDAFTVPATQNLKRVYTTPEALNNQARRYWDELDQTEFQPEIYNRLATNVTPGTFGTWLAVRIPNES